MENRRAVIVVRCYNQQEYIREALQSIFDQTTVDYDLVIFDDASSDESPSVIADCLKRATNRGDRLLLRPERNLGISKGVEFIASHIPDDAMIITQDGDDIALANRVETILGHATRHGTPFVTHAYIPFDGAATYPVVIPSPPSPDAPLPEVVGTRYGGYGLGLSSWLKDVFVSMPSLKEDMPSGEDKIIGFRMSLLHDIHVISTPLIRIRKVCGSASGKAKGAGFRFRMKEIRRSYLNSRRIDLQLMEELGNPLVGQKYSREEIFCARDLLRRRLDKIENELEALTKGPPASLLAFARNRLRIVRS